MNTNQEPTMSSKQIASMVEKRHDNVKRTMENLYNQGVISFTQFEEPTIGGGKPLTTYHVDERNSYIVVAQLSPQFTAKLVDEWKAMKEQQKQFKLPDFTNPYESALAWASEYKAKEEALLGKAEAEHKLVIAAPKINHYDTIVEKTNLVNATQVSTKIGISAQALNKRLDLLGVYNKNVLKGKTFRQWFINKGYGQVKQTANGYTQSLFTMKGEAWVIYQLSPVKTTCLLTITSH